MNRPTGFVGWASALGAACLGLAAIMSVAVIPMEAFFHPNPDVAGALMTSLIVAVLNVLLALVVMNAAGSRPGLTIVALIALGSGLYALGAVDSLVGHHPDASAYVLLPFWGVVAADALAAGLIVAAAIRVPKAGSSNSALPQ